MDGEAWWAAVHGGAKSQTWLSDFTFTFHFHALEKEMATHSSVLAWSIPGTREPGGLLSMGSQKRTWLKRLSSSILKRKHKSKAKVVAFSFFECCHSVAKLCSTPCNTLGCSTPGFPVLHYLLEFAQIHVLWVSDAIQPPHPLLPPSPPALILSQHQGLFQWVCAPHQVARVWEPQLQHQSFQWIFRVDFL